MFWRFETSSYCEPRLSSFYRYVIVMFRRAVTCYVVPVMFLLHDCSQLVRYHFGPSVCCAYFEVAIVFPF